MGHIPAGLTLTAAQPAAATASAATQSSDVTSTEKPVVNSGLNPEIMLVALLGDYSAILGDYAGASEYFFQIARRYRYEELFEKAIQYSLKQGSAERTTLISQSWLAAHPKSPKANLYGFTLQLRLNRYSASLEPLKTTLAISDLETQRALLRDLPMFYGNADNLSVLVPQLERLLAPYIKQANTAYFALVGIGPLRLRMNDIQGALAAAQAAAALDARNPKTISLFLALLEKGSLPAKAWLREQLNTNNDSLLLKVFLQWQSDNEGSRASLQTAQEVAKQHPGNAEIQLELAQLQIGASQWTGAQNTLLQASAVFNKTRSSQEKSETLWQLTQIKLAQVALKLGQTDRVAQLLLDMGDKEWPQQKLELRIARFIQLKQFDQAWALLEATPQTEDFQTANKHALFVKLLNDQGQAAKALQWMDQHIPPTPIDKQGQLQRAQLLERTGDSAAALQVYRATQQQFPTDAEAQNALGFSLADKGIDLDTAKALIVQAQKTLVGNPMVLDSLGWVEFKLGNMPAALNWLEQAYTLDADPEIAAHLGEVYWQLDRREQALATWRQAYDAAAPHEVLKQTLERLKVTLQPRQYQGRIKVQIEGAADGSAAQNLSAGFSISGTAQAGELSLTGPFGATLAQLNWHPGFAQLRQPNAKESFSDLPTLLQRVTGAPLPVEALFDWLQGKGLGAFAQAGWQATQNPGEMPRLQLERLQPPPPVRLTLILDETTQ